MSPADSSFTKDDLRTTQEKVFTRLRGLLNEAYKSQGDESALYGPISFVLTHFCANTSVTAPNFENLLLGSFPQKALKKADRGRKFRAPDFTVLVTQSGLHATKEMIGDIAPLIWEVKASPKARTWFGEARSRPLKFAASFMPHLDQIATQVHYAKTRFHNKPLYLFLSDDIWFILLYFPNEPPSLLWPTGKLGRPRLHPAAITEFRNYIIIPPSPIVNEDCSAFSPEFLYGLQLSIQNVPNVTVKLPPFLCPSEEIKEAIKKQLENLQLGATLDEARRCAEIEIQAIFGEDSGTPSAPEESETDIEHQKYPAAFLTDGNHLRTTPAKTRSTTRTLAEHAAAQDSNRPGPSNVSTTPSRTQAQRDVVADPKSVDEAAVHRPRRKVAARRSPGHQTEQQYLGDTDL